LGCSFKTTLIHPNYFIFIIVFPFSLNIPPVYQIRKSFLSPITELEANLVIDASQ
jgi:hypothetical protein